MILRYNALRDFRNELNQRRLCEKSGETNFDPLCIRIAGMTAKVVAYSIYMNY